MIDDEKKSRRTVLKKMGAGTLFPLGNFASQRENTVKLPELRNQDGVVRWIKVPRSWNQHRQQAEKVSDRMKKQYKNNGGVVEVGLIAGPEQFGGKRGFQVEIGIDKEKL